MSARARTLVVWLVAGAALAACTSPEATRVRGGGPGGDTGNRDRFVEMHGGSEPYWQTPRLLSEPVTRTAGQDGGRRPPAEAPAASPR